MRHHWNQVLCVGNRCFARFRVAVKKNHLAKATQMLVVVV